MHYWLDTTNLTRALRTYVSYMICKCRYIPISKVSIGSGWIPMNSILFCVSITFVCKMHPIGAKKKPPNRPHENIQRKNGFQRHMILQMIFF